MNSSARFILSSKSLKATSGSIIQNSAKCLVVLLFSALKVGPKVYTSLNAIAANSPSNCPLTVRLVLLPKKSSLKLIDPSSFFAAVPSNGNVVTLNISPAPSASLAVIIGVWR